MSEQYVSVLKRKKKQPFAPQIDQIYILQLSNITDQQIMNKSHNFSHKLCGEKTTNAPKSKMFSSPHKEEFQGVQKPKEIHELDYPRSEK